MPPSATTRWARRLRSEMTGVELLLWSRLRNRQLDGFKFRRQVPHGPYVCDFACLPAKLIVEVDGPGHDSRWHRDLERDAWLEGEGYQVLRFSADDVLRELDLVLEAILDALRSPSAALRAAPPH